jgi:G2/mitotic-specific cyclin 1/2
MSCACIIGNLVITQVSILVREWALERWEEGEQVSLLAELPAIRARNRAERERLAAAGLDGDEDDNA